MSTSEPPIRHSRYRQSSLRHECADGCVDQPCPRSTNGAASALSICARIAVRAHLARESNGQAAERARSGPAPATRPGSPFHRFAAPDQGPRVPKRNDPVHRDHYRRFR